MADTSAGYQVLRNPLPAVEMCAKCGYSTLNFWHRWGCVNGGRMPR